MTATAMLDVLIAIKMDLTVTPLFGTEGASDVQDRVNRACVTIETVIRDLKHVLDTEASGEGVPRGRMDGGHPSGDIRP